MSTDAGTVVPDHRGTLRGWLDFLRDFWRFARFYWNSAEKWRIRGLTASLIALTAMQVVIVVVLNKWTELLFNALEQRSIGQFLMLVGVLLLIIAANAAVVTTHLRVKRRIQIGWRDWLTRRLVDDWMTAGRHYQVTLVGGEHDNPDARIAEDTRIATEYAIDLGHSLLYCVILLVSFAHILWGLSGPPRFAVGEISIHFPGHLVWLAVAYAALGTAIALVLGRPLVRAANLRQREEANFRFGLTHARENALAIALLRGEADERSRFAGLFAAAVAAWDRQTTALTYVFLFTTSWSVMSLLFPVLITAPRYIAGAITLGVLMQTAQAFQQMVAALSWPIDNMAKAAEWRASAERMHGLHRALVTIERQTRAGDVDMIAIDPSGRPVLAFRDFSLSDRDGATVISSFTAEIEAGQRVLFAGQPGATVNLLKAMVGLWVWGRGRIEVPRGARIFVMPQRPYLPVGRLRDALRYPAAPGAEDDATLVAALRRVGLEHLVGRLDETAQWDHILSAGEQQRLGFARLLLHRPDWIFIQEAIDALDAAGEIEMLRLLREEFPAATIVAVGHRPPLAAFYQRVFVLKRDDGVAVVEECPADTGTKSGSAAD